MVEQSNNSNPELDLSFLKELPEDQLMDMNGAAHLINHFWDHKRIPNLDLNEMALVLKSSENQIAIAQKIINELERVGKCSFKDLPQNLVDEEIITVGLIWSNKFEKMKDREDPSWRKRAKKNLQKMRERFPD